MVGAASWFLEMTQKVAPLSGYQSINWTSIVCIQGTSNSIITARFRLPRTLLFKWLHENLIHTCNDLKAIFESHVFKNIEWIYFEKKNYCVVNQFCCWQLKLLRSLSSQNPNDWDVNNISGRVATKIFDGFGGKLCKEFNRGRDPVSIVYYTRPWFSIKQPTPNKLA